MKKRFFALLLTGLVCLLAVNRVGAQSAARVQVAKGTIKPGDLVVYDLPGMQEGDTVYIAMSSLSGNLDPLVGVANANGDLVGSLLSFQEDLQQALVDGANSRVALAETLDSYLLAWDDDSGAGHDAALRYTFPAGGDYRLLLSGGVANLGWQTFGEYRLLLGLNAPQVLDGEDTPAGEPFAFLNIEAVAPNWAVQLAGGTLSPEKSETYFPLRSFQPGDTLYISISASNGDLKPVLYLEDFSGKRVADVNVLGQADGGTTQYTFGGDTSGYILRLRSCCNQTGEYRLLVGVNAPEVLSGQAEPAGQPILQLPTIVYSGVRLQQITFVDQKSENYGVVATLQMEWDDPTLAFSPDDCRCRIKTYLDKDVEGFINSVQSRWPGFTFFNQQDNRWTQIRSVYVRADGHATYLERFTTKMQAPDFDFRRFPFDKQKFFIHTDLLFPEEAYTMAELEGYTQVGSQLGEEEWYITNWNTEISSLRANTEYTTSRFSFRFEARRHLDYYMFRIFVPILLILVVSWITFFLRDFSKRVDVSSGNLLAFIAFNFTISGDLPRLGYMTFMDAVLISAFIVTALVVVFNVILRRMEISGKGDLARRLDGPMVWLYPLSYVLAVGGVVLLFFR